MPPKKYGKVPDVILEVSKPGILPCEKVPEVTLEAGKLGTLSTLNVPVDILEASSKGISFCVKFLKEGVPETPEAGPANMVLSGWELKPTDNIPELVTGLLETVKTPEGMVKPTEVTAVGD